MQIALLLKTKYLTISITTELLIGISVIDAALFIFVPFIEVMITPWGTKE